MLKNKIFNIKNLWWLSLFFIAIFFHFKHSLNSDEGIILEGAWNLMNGRELYTNFTESITPGSFYLIFWTWIIFGVNFISAKAMAIIVLFLSSIGIYRISQLVSRSNFNLLPPFIFILSSFYWPIINHNVFNIATIIWAVYFFLISILNNSAETKLQLKQKQLLFIFLSGIFTGLSFLFLQHKSILLFIALTSFLFFLFIKEKKYEYIKLIFYYILSSFLLPLFLLAKWPLSVLYEQLFFFVGNVNKIFEHEFLIPYLFIFFLVVLILGFWFLKDKKPKKIIWLLLYVQLILLSLTFYRSDFHHVTVILFPLYCLLPLTIETIKTLKKPRALFAKFIVISSIFIIIYPSMISLFYFPPFSSVKNAPFLAYIEKNCPGQYIYAGPFIPGIYFETRKLNPGPHYALFSNAPSEWINNTLDALNKHYPTCAVINYKIVEKFNYKNNSIDNFIINNYRLGGKYGNTLIYTLNDPQ
jgi:hypothetical protein